MTIEIKEVCTKLQEKDFINLSWELYKNDKTWIPPLKISLKEIFNKKHPFYTAGKMKRFLAYKDGKVVGRIAAIINQEHNKFYQDKCGFFGFFESIEDKEVASKLFKTAEDYLKSEGMESVRGPMNPSTNYECGLLVKGFDDPPQVMMPYNPTYYENFFQENNYDKAMDLIAYKLNTNLKMPPQIVEAAQATEEKIGLKWRYINKKKWKEDLDKIIEIHNEAWKDNWGFVPLMKEEFYHTANEFKALVKENMILIAEIQDEVAGFIVAIPDFNQVFKEIPTGRLLPTGIFKLLNAKKYITRIRVPLLGVKSKFRKLGLGSLFYYQIQKEIQKNPQYVEAEQSWILEDNEKMNKPIQMMGGDPYKKYRIFEKALH